MFDVISIGEILIDFTPFKSTESSNLLFQQNPGGAPANVSCVMAKLGKKAGFIGKVGNDSFGKARKAALEEAGCDSQYLVMSEEFGTTLAFVTLSPDGNRDFSFYRNETTADVNLLLSDIPEAVYSNGRIFHFGSVSLSQEPSRSTVLAAVKKAKSVGAIISYDPNLRPPLWKSLEEAKSVILDALPLADIVKISDEEQRFLFGEEPEDSIGERLCASGVSMLVITKAKAGCTAYINGQRYDSKAYNVKTIDTTGAGDSFWAGILLKLLEADKKPANLSEEEIKAMLDFSNALGSLVTATRGAIAAIPTMEEIESCIANTPKI